MRKLICTLSLLTLLMISSCAGQGQRVPVEDVVDNFEVVKLFTVDGITVYRFTDDGRYHYFTNRNGQSLNTISDGKTTREEVIDNYGE